MHHKETNAGEVEDGKANTEMERTQLESQTKHRLARRKDRLGLRVADMVLRKEATARQSMRKTLLEKEECITCWQQHQFQDDLTMVDI